MAGRKARPDATDPATSGRYDDVIVDAP